MLLPVAVKIISNTRAKMGNPSMSMRFAIPRFMKNVANSSELPWGSVLCRRMVLPWFVQKSAILELIIKNNRGCDKIFRAKMENNPQLLAIIVQWHRLCYNFHIRGNKASPPIGSEGFAKWMSGKWKKWRCQILTWRKL